MTLEERIQEIEEEKDKRITTLKKVDEFIKEGWDISLDDILEHVHISGEKLKSTLMFFESKNIPINFKHSFVANDEVDEVYCTPYFEIFFNFAPESYKNDKYKVEKAKRDTIKLVQMKE